LRSQVRSKARAASSTRGKTISAPIAARSPDRARSKCAPQILDAIGEALASERRTHRNQIRKLRGQVRALQEQVRALQSEQKFRMVA